MLMLRNYKHYWRVLKNNSTLGTYTKSDDKAMLKLFEVLSGEDYIVQDANEEELAKIYKMQSEQLDILRKQAEAERDTWKERYRILREELRLLVSKT